MKASKYLFSTLKEIPSQIDSISTKLMIRSGMIRKISSGLYTWLPTGLRVLKKVQLIIKQELEQLNAIEISMPILQPVNLWKKSNRWNLYGNELLKVFDRRKKTFILSPTHEEMITSIIKNEIKSYKQLPVMLYQIQNKFRDELRPRSGTMRSREFLMKDAYSFHVNNSCLDKTYKNIRDTYSKIFKIMNINFKIVKANSKNMGGNTSHEFQAVLKSGEDKIAYSNNSNYASNIEITPIIYRNITNNSTKKNLIKEKKSLYKDIKKNFFKKEKNSELKNIVNTFLVTFIKNRKKKFAALLIREKHELNFSKVEQLQFISSPISLASSKEVFKLTDSSTFSVLNNYNKNIPIIMDIDITKTENFSLKNYNSDNKFTETNWKKKFKKIEIADIRNAISGDLTPDKLGGTLKVVRSAEIAHIFKIGSTYSKTMNAILKNNKKNKEFLKMGCYGIGISRLISTIVEQHHDSFGIFWPDSIAPFHVAIIPINFNDAKLITKTSLKLYTLLKINKFDVIIDDRKEYLGNQLSEMELIGIPHIVIISKKTVQNNSVEYRNRKTKKKLLIPIRKILEFLKINTHTYNKC